MQTEIKRESYEHPRISYCSVSIATPANQLASDEQCTRTKLQLSQRKTTRAGSKNSNAVGVGGGHNGVCNASTLPADTATALLLNPITLAGVNRH